MCVGRILNRFSKDIGYLDDLLPYIFCEYLLVSLREHVCTHQLTCVHFCTVAGQISGSFLGVVRVSDTCMRTLSDPSLSSFLSTHTHRHTNYFSSSHLSLMQWLFRSLSTLVTSVAAIPWLIVPCALMLGFFFLLRYYYICSAREVKRLEAIGNTQQLMYMHACYCIHMLSYTCSHLEA